MPRKRQKMRGFREVPDPASKLSPVDPNRTNSIDIGLCYVTPLTNESLVLSQPILVNGLWHVPTGRAILMRIRHPLNEKAWIATNRSWVDKQTRPCYADSYADIVGDMTEPTKEQHDIGLHLFFHKVGITQFSLCVWESPALTTVASRFYVASYSTSLFNNLVTEWKSRKKAAQQERLFTLLAYGFDLNCTLRALPLEILHHLLHFVT